MSYQYLTGKEAGPSRRLAPTHTTIVLCLLLTSLLRPEAAHAQRAGDGFLFKPPAATLTLRGGMALASGKSEIFAFTTKELTLNRGDFHSPQLGIDLGLRLTRQAELAFGVGYAGSRAKSEFRDWVDQDDLPIQQTTSFRRVPLTATLKAYLLPPGRTIGRFAWMPSRWAPYIGVGGGALWYRFSQRGDFVDFDTLEIFGDHLNSSGWTGTYHALAGVDFSLNPRWALTAEGRYSRASTELSDVFRGFDKIDLSGFATTIGIQLRF